MKNSFKNVATTEDNPKWTNLISRQKPLYKRGNDMRSEFARDYTRIIYSNAYKRLKHKTQVFFSPKNDHICTRIEHVNHVESISFTIANYLGLNTELTKSIATAHDLGHSPFGHCGERILSEISKKDLGYSFWHEKNGLDFVDKFELLEDNENFKQNLNLTYAVRDGIISHCGEINENSLFPRNDFIDLQKDYQYPNEFAPYSWEGCVVKIADKISYIGRDIEDAILLNILDNHLCELYDILHLNSTEKINNTIIINNLIYDLCQNSSPEKGLCFSKEKLDLLDNIKDFNYKNIYFCDKIKASNRYFDLVLNEIYSTLKSLYDDKNTLKNLEHLSRFYPNLANSFHNWLYCYWNLHDRNLFKNDIVFDISNFEDFCHGILYFISGMTDNFAIDIYNEIIGF